MTNGDNDKDWADERAEKWFELDCPRETYLGSSMVGGRELKKAVASLLRIVARDQQYASVEAVLAIEDDGPGSVRRGISAVQGAIMNANPKGESR